MSTLTNRVTDSNLAELAKQNYQKTQINKVPAEIVHLTSKGLVYPTTSLLRKGYVEMRYMTAYDEDIITNTSYVREGIVFDKLLAALIVDDIDINDIAACDKDGLIINARILGYGANYDVTVTEPATSKTIKSAIDLSKLRTTEFNLLSDDRGEFDYVINDSTKIKFKHLTSRDINSIKEINSISGLLELLIKEVNGNRELNTIQNFIRYDFRAADAKKFREYVSNNTPTIIKEWNFESESGGTFTAGFQFDAGLFWS